MTQSTIILIVLSFFLGLAAWLVFLWAVRKGEFDDLEGPKHRMLEEDDHPLPPHPPASKQASAKTKGNHGGQT